MAGLNSKGTHLYFIDTITGDVVQVGCPTNISGISAAREQIETTCLESEGREYEPGLPAPSTATFALQFNPGDASHKLLHDYFSAANAQNLQWAIGFSDGTAVPTADTAGDFVLPTTRSFLLFAGYVADYPFEFALNAKVISTLSVQMSGAPVLQVKTP